MFQNKYKNRIVLVLLICTAFAFKGITDTSFIKVEMDTLFNRISGDTTIFNIVKHEIPILDTNVLVSQDTVEQELILNPTKSISFKLVWAKVQERYAEVTDLETKIHVFLDGMEMPEYQSLFQKSGKNHRYKMVGTETILNELGSVFINHETKEITYSPDYELTSNVTNGIINSLKIPLDDESVEFIGDDKGMMHFRVSTSGLIKTTDLFISSSSYLLEEVRYKYNDEMDMGQVESHVVYENNLNPNFQKNLLDITRVFKGTGKSAKLSEAFNKYNYFINLKS